MSPAPHLVPKTLGLSTAGFPKDRSSPSTTGSFGTEGRREVTFAFPKFLLGHRPVSTGASWGAGPVAVPPSALAQRVDSLVSLHGMCEGQTTWRIFVGEAAPRQGRERSSGGVLGNSL